MCEIWYRNDEVLQISDYVSHYRHRCNKKGGGVVLLTRTNLHSELLKDFTQITADFEILTVLRGRSIFCVLYRPPGGNVVNFLKCIDNMVSWTNDNDYSLVFGGNVIINMSYDSPLRRDTLRVLESNACIITITAPTGIQGNCECLLDVFITNLDTQNIESGIITAHVSDHLLIFLLFNSPVFPSRIFKDQHFPYLDINPFTLEKFLSEILRINWQDVYNEKDCDKAYELFLSFFSERFQKVI